jgi:hypothetical protein
MRNLAFVALLLGAVTLGCETKTIAPDAPLGALLEGSPVVPGGYLTLEYRNTTGVAIGLHECGRGIERLTAGDWVAMPEELRMCPGALQVLRPDEQIELRLDVPADIASGTYRFVLRVYAVNEAIPSANQLITTAPFEVEQ